MSLPVRFFEHGDEEPLADIEALPSQQLQRVAFWWLKRVQRQPRLGASLAYQRSTGNLSDCRKIYFDEDDEPWNLLWEPRRRVADDPRPRYRIVYRLISGDEAPTFVEVISVGPKPAVYWKASARLERR
jgi:hypothetical protein